MKPEGLGSRRAGGVSHSRVSEPGLPFKFAGLQGNQLRRSRRGSRRDHWPGGTCDNPWHSLQGHWRLLPRPHPCGPGITGDTAGHCLQTGTPGRTQAQPPHREPHRAGVSAASGPCSIGSRQLACLPGAEGTSAAALGARGGAGKPRAWPHHRTPRCVPLDASSSSPPPSSQPISGVLPAGPHPHPQGCHPQHPLHPAWEPKAGQEALGDRAGAGGRWGWAEKPSFTRGLACPLPASQRGHPEGWLHTPPSWDSKRGLTVGPAAEVAGWHVGTGTARGHGRVKQKTARGQQRWGLPAADQGAAGGTGR